LISFPSKRVDDVVDDIKETLMKDTMKIFPPNDTFNSFNGRKKKRIMMMLKESKLSLLTRLIIFCSSKYIIIRIEKRGKLSITALLIYINNI
jgi:hypothetical protein